MFLSLRLEQGRLAAEAEDAKAEEMGNGPPLDNPPREPRVSKMVGLIQPDDRKAAKLKYVC